MSKLEKQVRNAMIDKRTNLLVDYLNENPKVKSAIFEDAQKTMESIMNSIYSNFDLEENELKECKKEMKEEVELETKKYMENDEKMEELLYEKASNEYLSLEELEYNLEAQLIHLKEYGVSEKTLSNYKNLFEESFEIVKEQEKIIKGITEIAEEKGIDNATEKETIYSVIREMYPTADEYRELINKKVENVLSLFKKSQDILSEDEGEISQLLSGFYAGMGKSIEENKLIEIYKESMEKEIKEIYN